MSAPIVMDTTALEAIGEETDLLEEEEAVEPTDGADVPEEPEGDTEPTVDLANLTDDEIAKLPAEVQPLAKSLKGDYTKKAQKLAEDRKALESEDVAWARDFIEAARTDPKGAQKMLRDALGDEAPAPTSKPSEAAAPTIPDEVREAWADLDPAARTIVSFMGQLIDAGETKRAALETELQDVKRQSSAAIESVAAKEIQAEMQTLAEKYGDLDEEQQDAVLQIAMNITPNARSKYTPLETGWRALMLDQAQTKGEQVTRKRLAAKTALSDDTPSGRPAQVEVRPKTMAEAFAVAETTVPKPRRAVRPTE